nr:sigma 54-interacting transcriptional regulator [Anaerovorax odorimutans]
MVFWGEEHYNLVHKKYTCSGAPIHGANGEIIGAISLTGRKEDYQEHTLGIVISIVDAIEAELRSRNTKKGPSATEYTFDNLIGECKEMKEMTEIAKQVAKIDAPILLWGESGTGKEVLAQSIHNESLRKSGPFIGINCGAIPRELIESELFGYEEGSFTGASRGGRPGKLEAASGGTLFLDEVESMPLDVQIKLLRVLSTFKVTRVGSNKEIPIDIRIISASKSDLYLEAEQGRFREDLYYRINTITLKIPPLRKRNGDIRLLADYYIEQLKKNMGLSKLIVPKSFYDMLENYDWKGNVRELKNILEGVIAMSKEGEEINTSMLPDRMVNKTRNTRLKNTRLKEAEIEIIKNEIEKAGGNLSAAAKALGIARSTLYQKLKNNTELSEYLKK